MIIGRNVPRISLSALLLKLCIPVYLTLLVACASIPELSLDPETEAPAVEEPEQPAESPDSDSELLTEAAPALTQDPVAAAPESPPLIPPLEKAPTAEPIAAKPAAEPVQPPAPPEPAVEQPTERQPVSTAEPTLEEEESEPISTADSSQEPAEPAEDEPAQPASAEKIIPEELSDLSEEEESADQEEALPKSEEEIAPRKPISTSDIILEDKKQNSNTALIVLVVSLVLAALIVTVAYLMRKHSNTYEETLNPAKTYEDHLSQSSERPGYTAGDAPEKEKRAEPRPRESDPGLLVQAVLHVYAKILGGRTVQSLGSIEEFAAAAFQVDLSTLQQMLISRKNLKKQDASYIEYLTRYIQGISRTEIDMICTLTVLMLAVDGMLYSEEVKALQTIAALMRTDSTFIDHIIEEYSITVSRPRFPGQARLGTAVPLSFASRETMPPEELYHKFPEMEHIDSTILVGIIQLLDELRDEGEPGSS